MPLFLLFLRMSIRIALTILSGNVVVLEKAKNGSLRNGFKNDAIAMGETLQAPGIFDRFSGFCGDIRLSGPP